MHALLLEAPSRVDHVPAWQAVHKSAEEARRMLDQVPTGHMSHAVAPTVDDHVPALQLVHTFESLAPLTTDQVPAKH